MSNNAIQQPTATAVNPSQPQNQQAAPNAANPRGRGRGRGRPNFANRNRARADINPDGAPVALDSKFLGMTSLKRGNVTIEIDPAFTERLSTDYSNTIKSAQESKGFFDQEGEPLDHERLTRGLGGALCLTAAVKLLQATPNSEIPQIATFRSFREYQLSVPRSYIQVLDLIGKCDYQDWTLRIKHNPTLIQRMLLKAIKYFQNDDNFTKDYVSLNEEDLSNFNKLRAFSFTQLEHVFFPDIGSVKQIKEEALKFINSKINNNFEVTIDGSQITVSYPQLPPDPTKQQIMDWLPKFTKHHPDHMPIILAGVLLLVELRWLENPTAKMSDIDDDFKNSNAKDMTPIQMLNACGLHHYSEFLSKQHFIEIARNCYTYYEETITHRLKSIFVLQPQGNQTLGSEAQLVFIPQDMKVHRKTMNIDRTDLDPNLNHSLSFVKLATGDKIVKSSMLGLVRDVELDPDYEAHFSTTLLSTRKGFMARDGVIGSQNSMYK